jgi:hypothetical protein
MKYRILKCCLECEFHEFKESIRKELSYCRNENCFSENTDCVLNKSLDKFLEDNEVKSIHLINKAKYGRS